MNVSWKKYITLINWKKNKTTTPANLGGNRTNVKFKSYQRRRFVSKIFNLRKRLNQGLGLLVKRIKVFEIKNDISRKTTSKQFPVHKAKLSGEVTFTSKTHG